MNKAVITKLSTRQKTAWLKMNPLVQKGMSISEAARKTKLEAFDYHNAKARLSGIMAKVKPVTTPKAPKKIDAKTKAAITTYLKKAAIDMKTLPTQVLLPYHRILTIELLGRMKIDG